MSEQRWDLTVAKMTTKRPEWPPCAVLQPRAPVYQIKSALYTSGWLEGSCQHTGVCPLLRRIPTILPGGCIDPHGESQPSDRLLSPVPVRDRKAALKPRRWDAPAAAHELEAEAALRRAQGKQDPATRKSKAA